MPLPVLLALVVAGIGGIALLLHLTGRSRTLAMTPESATAEWLRQYPDDEVLEALPAHDGRAELIVARR